MPRQGSRSAPHLWGAALVWWPLGRGACLEAVHVANQLVVSDEGARTDFHGLDLTRGHELIERAATYSLLIERAGDGVQQTGHAARHVVWGHVVRVLPVSSTRTRVAIDYDA